MHFKRIYSYWSELPKTFLQFVVYVLYKENVVNTFYYFFCNRKSSIYKTDSISICQSFNFTRVFSLLALLQFVAANVKEMTDFPCESVARAH